ncbi:hypothetical protein Pan216_23820 [Planctomycetes bacterium Pan216]|uniref:Type VI secretion protein n=1 Tax=Kolteria novifilia TaxID=2527975 RepID=A0A518B3G0_9BACT|nr:hypothetical protein Pan216_23820 [Planctomycetes bacterium Pan216]
MPIGDQVNERARVNLEYKSKIAGGRNVKLPYRMLVVGDFSPTHAEKEKEIGDRRAWQVDKSTFNQTLAEMAPKLEGVIDNMIEDSEGGERKKLGINLDFKHRDDFRPERLLEQIPELKEMARVRDLVKDLRAKMVRSDDLRKAIEGALRDPEARKKLEQELTSRQSSADEGAPSEEG